MSHAPFMRATRLVGVLLLAATVTTACTRQDDALGGHVPELQVRGLPATVTAPIELVRPSGAVRSLQNGTDLRALRGTLRAEPVRHGAAVLLPAPARAEVDGSRGLTVDYHAMERRAAAPVEPAERVTGRRAVRGVVWHDVDDDGRFGSGHGDAALRGATVLLDADGDGEADPGEPRATTGATGTYAVSGLDPDVSYVPVVVSPDGATLGRGTIRQRPW